MARRGFGLPLYPHEQVIQHYGASFVAPACLYLLTAGALGAFYYLFPQVLTLVAIVIVFASAALHAAVRGQYLWILTNERLVERRGILTRQTITVRHDRVTDTGSRVPVLSGLFGTGEVSVSTAGSEGTIITVFAQHDPHRLEQLLNNLKRENRYRSHEGGEG
jgi:membrane protein YdbS with pleckstrin-like domain